jgi:hypothetical protein
MSESTKSSHFPFFVFSLFRAFVIRPSYGHWLMMRSPRLLQPASRSIDGRTRKTAKQRNLGTMENSFGTIASTTEPIVSAH